ncbi:Hypothetical predicted protein [Podarcis lilfordi]|uniref:Uncharacterized protein n=1 Tax=Podarcis lilfordi TaxID=74358 RepID=A0AA35JLR7_9SAUR|nr:Hypothetical predicted protein [Podarcis lilfordi]
MEGIQYRAKAIVLQGKYFSFRSEQPPSSPLLGLFHGFSWVGVISGGEEGKALLGNWKSLRRISTDRAPRLKPTQRGQAAFSRGLSTQSSFEGGKLHENLSAHANNEASGGQLCILLLHYLYSIHCYKWWQKWV